MLSSVCSFSSAADLEKSNLAPGPVLGIHLCSQARHLPGTGPPSRVGKRQGRRPFRYSVRGAPSSPVPRARGIPTSRVARRVHARCRRKATRRFAARKPQSASGAGSSRFAEPSSAKRSAWPGARQRQRGGFGGVAKTRELVLAVAAAPAWIATAQYRGTWPARGRLTHDLKPRLGSAAASALPTARTLSLHAGAVQSQDRRSCGGVSAARSLRLRFSYLRAWASASRAALTAAPQGSLASDRVVFGPAREGGGARAGGRPSARFDTSRRRAMYSRVVPLFADRTETINPNRYAHCCRLESPRFHA